MARWVICLPRKCKDFTSIPRSHRKTGFGHSSLWCALRRRVGVIPGTWGQPVHWNQQAPAQWKTLTLLNADSWFTPGVTPYSYTYICGTHTHSHTYMCGTHINQTNYIHKNKQTWSHEGVSEQVDYSLMLAMFLKLEGSNCWTLYYTSSPRTRTFML